MGDNTVHKSISTRLKNTNEFEILKKINYEPKNLEKKTFIDLRQSGAFSSQGENIFTIFSHI